MSKVKKTIKLSEATFSQVSEFLKKKVFHAEMAEANARKVDSDISFKFWKEEILKRFPEAIINITQGAEWFEEVRVSDPFFNQEKQSYREFRSNAIQGYK